MGVDQAVAAQRRHPALHSAQLERAENFQFRIADAITKFAGSMPFVYAHVVAFALWMIVFEKAPWPTLTLVVSLEAIFLSTFVMIGQNRQAAFQQRKADHDFVESELELKANTELTRQIHDLLTGLDQRTRRDTDPARDPMSPPSGTRRPPSSPPPNRADE